MLITSPFLITESLALLSLFAAFAVAIFASNAVLRDSEFAMEEIVFTTPVGRVAYVASRFTGAYAAALTAMAFAVPGMMLATRMPWIDAERVGPISPLAYAQAFLLFAVPNILFITAILFFVAVMTRSAVATYVAAALLYFLYFAAAALTNSPLMAGSAPGATSGAWVALLDPFGLSGFFEQTRFWTIAEKNTRVVSLTGTLLLNRAAWLGIAVALGALLTKIFAFQVTPKRSSRGGVVAAASAATGRAKRPSPHWNWNSQSSRGDSWPWLAAFRSSAKIERSLLLRSVPFILLLVAWTLLSITEVASSITAAEYGSLYYPTTALTTRALQQPLSIMATLLLIWFAAEIFWREARFRFAGIAESAPLRGSEIIAAKIAALVTLVVSLIGCSIVAAVIVQIAHGWFRFEPHLYLAFAYFTGAPLVALAMAFALIHAVSPGRHVGMVATLLFVICTRIGGAIGLDNRLWRFGTAAMPGYSELNGFDRSAVAFHWFMLLWLVVGFAAAVIASSMWRRSGRSIRERLVLASRSKLAAALLIPIALIGGWIYYNTDIVNRNETAGQVNDWKAAYEKTYGPFAKAPRPRIAEIDAAFDLAPERQSVRAHGTYRLINSTNGPLSMMFVSVRRDARRVALSVDGARLASADARFGMYRFELAQPLAAGASTTLHYDLTLEERGFEDGAGENAIVHNGSYLMSFRIMPSIGYRATYELQDRKERARYGLPAVEEVVRDDTHGDEEEEAAADWVKLSTTISTSPDQIAVGPGHLEREWRENGRRFFRYRAEPLVINRFAIASARYNVQHCARQPIDVAVYYHPGHEVNVARMCDAATSSLALFTQRFGPYPHRDLRLVEAPAHAPFAGYATPSVLFFNEGRSFLIDARDPARVDLVTRRVAHEVAHQWWGYRIDAITGRGAPAIVESLTKYAELMIIEKKYGRDAARQLLEFENDNYLAGRAAENDEEVPLVDVANQQYVYYGKGAVVMNGIRDLAGDEPMFHALRAFLEEHSGPGKFATSNDLANALRAAVPNEDRPLVDQWMREIIVYDFAIESAVASKRIDGRFDVQVKVSATKRKATRRGVETPLPFREQIEIALDDKTERVVLHEGTNELTFITGTAPRLVTVDPFVTRIDTTRANNARTITTKPAS
ncbi:MAG: hypothetical protein JWO97_3413 [Acidobacteria bacterium]|nr:hypothetical protein [Acidobacteriota bacterium]